MAGSVKKIVFLTGITLNLTACPFAEGPNTFSDGDGRRQIAGEDEIFQPEPIDESVQETLDSDGVKPQPSDPVSVQKPAKTNSQSGPPDTQPSDPGLKQSLVNPDGLKSGGTITSPVGQNTADQTVKVTAGESGHEPKREISVPSKNRINSQAKAKKSPDRHVSFQKPGKVPNYYSYDFEHEYDKSSEFWDALLAVGSGAAAGVGISALGWWLLGENNHPDYPFFIAPDGIARSPGSLLITENLNHFNGEILEEKYPGLIAVTVAEQDEKSGILLTERDHRNLYDNIFDRLTLYYSEESTRDKSVYPLLSVSVNTGGIHWETVIIDFKKLAGFAPTFEYEQWNFLGASHTLGKEKIIQVRSVVQEVLENLLKDGVEVPVLWIKSSQEKFWGKKRPKNQTVLEYLKEYYKSGELAKLDIKVTHKKGNTFAVTYQGRTYDAPLTNQGVNRYNKKHFWEVRYPHFKYVAKQPKLIEMLTAYRDVHKPDLAQVNNLASGRENLIQGENNCGVASAWITEQRMNRSPEDILHQNPGGYHQYRRDMLKTLHARFPEVRLPETLQLAYPSDSY